MRMRPSAWSRASAAGGTWSTRGCVTTMIVPYWWRIQRKALNHAYAKPSHDLVCMPNQVMLFMYAKPSHQVWSWRAQVAIFSSKAPDRASPVAQFAETTEVTFAPLSDDEIRAYAR
jgi:hypothetical protein